jgi:hypothetical protein
MKLTQDLKRMLNALAYANAGEYLTRRQKSNLLVGTPAQTPKHAPVTPCAATAKPRSQVGLYLGREVSADVMQYVTQTCARLRHGLMVFSFQSEAEVGALLDPYREIFDAAGIQLQAIALSGEPPTALSRALRRRPEVAFLVCNESGYLGRSLLKGTVRQDAIPVPVVMVAGGDEAAPHLHTETSDTHVRAA